MASLRKKWKGLAFCLLLAVPSWFLGKMFSIIGGVVAAIIAGMAITIFIKNKDGLEGGIKFISKKILQWVVTLLRFGMNLDMVLETEKQPLPIIVCIIVTSLMTAFAFHKLIRIPSNVPTPVGVGSSICGGSIVTATAPVINADDDEVAQAISVVFFFNVPTAILFLTLSKVLGFDTTSDNAFGILAGTAINGISSITVAAATWDSIWNLGTATLDKTVAVEPTRALAITPTILCLVFIRTRKGEKGDQINGQSVSFRDVPPFFTPYLIGAPVITTIATGAGVPASVFALIKELSKFFITLVMAAIGLNTDPVKLIHTGDKSMLMDACCQVRIIVVNLGLQNALGIR